MAITVPGGSQVAIEVQLGELSDAQWLARHHDYAQAAITDVWLWHQTTWVPRVMFIHRQPGWLLDLDDDQIGLIHTQPPSTDDSRPPGPPGCGDMHWPPCPDDQLGVLWMPLASARLTPRWHPARHQGRGRACPAGSNDPAITAQTTPATTPPPAASRTSDNQATMPPPATRISADDEQQPTGAPSTHHAFRYDAFPPWADPDTWWFHCDTCGRSYTAAEIHASPILHTVPSAGPLTPTDQHLITYTRYGTTTSSTEQRPPS